MKPDQDLLARILAELERGTPRQRIPSLLNLNFRRFNAVMASPEMLALARVKAPQVAADLEAERAPGAPSALANALPEAIETLLEIMRNGESDAQRRGAARDIVELAETRERTAAIAAKAGVGREGEVVQFLPSQLAALSEVARELREAEAEARDASKRSN